MSRAVSEFRRSDLVPTGPSKARFEVLYKSGIVASSKNLRLIAGSGDGKIGIATAKALGCKPHRNLAKRRMREIVRCNATAWRPQMDYLVVMKAESNRTPYEVLNREALDLLNDLNKRWDSASESF